MAVLFRHLSKVTSSAECMIRTQGLWNRIILLHNEPINFKNFTPENALEVIPRVVCRRQLYQGEIT